ncbi:MAG: hypothetical protein ACI97B_004256 [Verrucomicrobiales bacterium]|jgi:hypothetical protein
MTRTLHLILGYLIASLTFLPVSHAQAQQQVQVVPPTVIPKSFKTRKVGTTLSVTASGTARSVVVRVGQPPLIELAMDGKTHRIFPGRYVKVGNVTYKAMGWQKDHFLLFSASKSKSLYFAKTEPTKP